MRSCNLAYLQEMAKLSRSLHPKAAERKRLLNQVMAYANQFLEEIETAPAYVPTPNDPGLDDLKIRETGIDIAEAILQLNKSVDSIGINLCSGHYLGYVPSGGLFHAALGDFLAAITNRFAGLHTVSPGAVKMENMLLKWMADIVGYPEFARGNLTSGGSMANLISVVTARDAFEVVGKEIGRAVVYITDQTHHSVAKALRIAGLGRCVVRKIPVDPACRMDPSALDKALAADGSAGKRPWLIVASAGTTNTGAVDPLGEIAEIAERYGAWLHVDGAYGGFFVLCPEGHQVLRGMHLSDSLVLDPHKSLFMPYGTGAVLVKDGPKLYRAFKAEADYLQSDLDGAEEPSPADLSPELSKHFRGLRIWLSLMVLGIAPFRAALSEKIHLARYFHQKIKHRKGFEVGPYPDLSIATYRYIPKWGDADAFNHRLMRAVQNEGKIYISSTLIKGKVVLRTAILSFRTHLDEVKQALDVLAKTAKRLEEE